MVVNITVATAATITNDIAATVSFLGWFIRISSWRNLTLGRLRLIRGMPYDRGHAAFALVLQGLAQVSNGLDPPATGMCRLSFLSSCGMNFDVDHRPTRPSRWLDNQDDPLLRGSRGAAASTPKRVRIPTVFSCGCGSAAVRPTCPRLGCFVGRSQSFDRRTGNQKMCRDTAPAPSARRR